MIWRILELVLCCVGMYVAYYYAKSEGTWSWKLFLGFFAALGLFAVGYLVPMVNSAWLAAHPDDFGWVVFGPGSLLVIGFYICYWRIQKAGKG